MQSDFWKYYLPFCSPKAIGEPSVKETNRMRTQSTALFVLIVTTLLGMPSPATSGPILQKVDTLTQQERSLATYRILNEIGIRYENAKTKAFKLIARSEYTEARNVFEQIIKELKECVRSSNMRVGLTDGDRQFVHQRLVRMQKRIEHIIDDLPPGI